MKNMRDMVAVFRIMISEPDRAILDTVIVLKYNGPAIDIDSLQAPKLG